MANEKKEKIIKKISPYYYQLEILIKEKIDSKEWKTGDFVPSERNLCDKFDVSRVTVRKALQNLVGYGYLKKIPNRGLIVRKTPFKKGLMGQAVSFYKYLTDRGFTVKNKIINFRRIYPSKHIKEFLRLDDKQEVYEIVRLRLVNGEPWYYTDIYLPVYLFPDLKEEDILKGSILNLLKNKYNMFVHEAKRFFYSNIANMDNSRLLSIKNNSPISIIEGISYSKNNLPYEYAINYFRQDKIIFEMNISVDKNLLEIKEKKMGIIS